MRQVYSLIVVVMMTAGCTDGSRGSAITKLTQEGTASTSTSPPFVTQGEIQQKDDIIRIDCCFPTKGKQVVRGESTEIIVVGKNFPEIQSVEVNPSQGISVREIKEEEPNQDEKREGKKRWRIVVFADLQAQPGKRSVAMITSEGRSEPKTIVIPTHVPKITNLSVLSTESSNAKVHFTFEAFDEAGDLGERPYIFYMLRCGYSASMSFFPDGKGVKVLKKDHRNSIVDATAESPGSTASGWCTIKVGIEDKNGYESSHIEKEIEFK